MKNYLIVRNFGPIKDLNIVLKKFVVIIGSQGTGKSTAAKILNIMHDILFWQAIVYDRNPKSFFKKMKLDLFFKAESFIDFKFENIHIQYKDGSFSIEDTHRDCSSGEKLNFDKFEQIALNKSLRRLIINNEISEDQKRFIWSFCRFVCYIPAERNFAGIVAASLASLIQADVPLPSTLMEFLALFEKSKNTNTSFKVPFLGVNYVRGNGDDCIEVGDNNEKHLPLAACSSGIQSALPLMMVMDYCLKEDCFNFFVIEEPEQNLFPENQRQLLNYILRTRSIDRETKFVLNTHSPYILSVLNVNMLASKLSKNPKLKADVEKIVSPECLIDSSDVAVYALNFSEEVYCQNLIDEKTGLIAQNFLDSASEKISADFNRLYNLYVKANRQ